MNCDMVFDVLTRGPFPSGGRDDELVERHLSACHECRQLAEALRPAVSLFHESLTDEETSRLPGYEGRLAEPQSSLAVAVMRAVEAERTCDAAACAPTPCASQPRRRRPVGWQPLLAASLLLLASLTAIVLRHNSTVNEVQAAAEPSWQTLDRLAADTLFQRCRHSVAGHDLVAMNSHKLLARCCVECHNPAIRHSPRIDAASVMEQSCSVCHIAR